MADSVIFCKHDGETAARKYRGDYNYPYYENRWVERYHGRDLKKRVNKPYEFDCTHVVHFTENSSANEIGNNPEYPGEFCFKPSKWIPEKDGENSISFLSWWAAVPPANWEKTVKDAIPDLLNIYKTCLGNSPAFNGESLCGPIGFVCSWNDILSEYAKSRLCQMDDLELRILGTFLYSAEIIYGVLVCEKGDKLTFLTDPESTYGDPVKHVFEKMKEDTQAFIQSDKNGFKWKVYSTIGYSESGIRAADKIKFTWDHLSFAFYFPQKNVKSEEKSIDSPSTTTQGNNISSQGCDLFKISHRFCKIETKLATAARPYSRSELPKRSVLERCADGEFVHRLKTKISNDKLFPQEIPEQAFDQMNI